MDERNDTEKKLIEAAIDLFSSCGFKGTSIRDIAKVTGMTISSIYYYFGSKEGLLLAILQHSSKDLLYILREAAQSELEPLERFKALIQTHLNLVKVHKKEAKIFFLDEEHLSPEGIKNNKQYQIEILDIYRTQLKGLQALRYIGYQNLSVLALNVLGVINWHLRWYRPNGPLPLEHLSQEITEFILHGVLNRPVPDTQPVPSAPPNPNKG